MSRNRNLIIVIVLVAVVAVAYQLWPRPFEPITMEEGFEEGISDWIRGADVPEDPNNPGNLVVYNITRSDLQHYESASSAEFTIDGLQDDGTIWLMRSFSVPAGASNIELEFQLYSDSESFNTIAVVVAYIGSEQPMTEEDFVVLGPANQVTGWKLYELSVESETGELLVAYGISVRWEALMIYWVDNVKVILR